MKGEYPFRVIAHQFGYRAVRYRVFAKDNAQITTLFALSNLRMVHKLLLASVQVNIGFLTSTIARIAHNDLHKDKAGCKR